MTRYGSAILAVAALCNQGCENLPKSVPSLPEDVAPVSRERQQGAIEQVEEKRDATIMQSALARWQAGDLAACETQLMSLLSRNMEQREARLMLAELFVSTGRVAAAERELNWLIDRFPDDPRAHHALGLLHETHGQADLATASLERAAQLAPDDPLYAISYEANLLTRGSSPSPVHAVTHSVSDSATQYK